MEDQETVIIRTFSVSSSLYSVFSSDHFRKLFWSQPTLSLWFSGSFCKERSQSSPLWILLTLFHGFLITANSVSWFSGSFARSALRTHRSEFQSHSLLSASHQPNFSSTAMSSETTTTRYLFCSLSCGLGFLGVLWKTVESVGAIFVMFSRVLRRSGGSVS